MASPLPPHEVNPRSIYRLSSMPNLRYAQTAEGCDDVKVGLLPQSQWSLYPDEGVTNQVTPVDTFFAPGTNTRPAYRRHSVHDFRSAASFHPWDGIDSISSTSPELNGHNRHVHEDVANPTSVSEVSNGSTYR